MDNENYTNSYNILDKFIASFRLKEMKKNVSLEGKNVIDFGCGSDFTKLTNIYSECKKITAIDKTENDFKKKNLNYINYDNDLNLLDEKVENNFYDIIILTAVIEHLDNPEIILNILKKKLINNGIIFLTAPSWKSKPILEFLAYKLKIINEHLIREHKRYYDLEEYKKLSKLINLKIKKFYFFQFGMNTVCILN